MSKVKKTIIGNCTIHENAIGQKAWSDGHVETNEIVAPAEKVLTWIGRGYSGGHVSQSNWDVDQEHRKMGQLIRAGYGVQNTTKEGQTGGYFPSVKYWEI